MMCSREECLCTVICALYDISKGIYTSTGWVSCQLHDVGFGGVYLGTYTFRDRSLDTSQFMAHYTLLT